MTRLSEEPLAVPDDLEGVGGFGGGSYGTVDDDIGGLDDASMVTLDDDLIPSEAITADEGQKPVEESLPVDEIDDPMKVLFDGFETTSAAGDGLQVKKAVKAVEEVVRIVVDASPDGFEPPDDLVEEPEVVASKVTEAVVNGNRYAQAPIPIEVEEASFDDLLRKLAGDDSMGMMT